VGAALEAAAVLERQGVSARVLDVHTVKPLDTDTLALAAAETGRVLVIEEHLSHGGLGSCIAYALASTHPVPMGFVNLGDRVAESGAPGELLEKYGLTYPSIVTAANELLERS
jgi:transketolase